MPKISDLQSDSQNRTANLTSWKNWQLAVVLLSTLCAFGYLLSSKLTQETGFPLDDAWIHQTYARNLVLTGQWAFQSGQPSAGSTAPLWSALLAVGYIFRLTPFFWTFLLGISSLGILASTGEQLFQSLWKNDHEKSWPWFGLFLAGEWHLVWAAVSGMETILFSLVILAFLFQLISPTRHWLCLGLLAGISAWLRPEGFTLLGPAVFVLILDSQVIEIRFKEFLLLLTGFVLAFAPYLFFNTSFSGSIWPNTFFAKQAEYSSALTYPFLQRLVALSSLPLIGASALFLPGFLFSVYKTIRERSVWSGAVLLWWFGFTLIYVFRLPVVYQHGRYLIPSMPVFFLFGAVGSVWLWQSLANPKPIYRKAWLFSVGLLWVAFYALGARAYATDVAIIQTEMVSASKWVEQNTLREAVIAAHDIGALGYYSNRRLIDLAGLISPQVIPFVRDEGKIRSFIEENKVDYLVTFPDWYPQLIRGKKVIFETHGNYSPAQGGRNMTIYQWKSD